MPLMVEENAPLLPREDDLHNAAREVDVDAVRRILESAPDRVNETDDRDYTPLMYAALAGMDGCNAGFEVAKFLLEAGADKDMQTLVHLGLPMDAKYMALTEHNEKIADLIDSAPSAPMPCGGQSGGGATENALTSEDRQAQNDHRLDKLGLSMEDLKEIFEMFDTDGSGTVDAKEFGTLMAALGAPIRASMRDLILKHIDQDQNGQIDLMEFTNWFLSRDWKVQIEAAECDLKTAGLIDRLDKEFYYDWDYTKTESENFASYSTAMAARRVAVSGKDGEVEIKRDMIMYQLLFPLWVKKAIRAVNASGADNNSGKSENHFVVQCGNPDEDKNSACFYFKPCGEESFAALNPPETAGVGGAVDFGVREGATEADLEDVAKILNELFVEWVQPLIDNGNRKARSFQEVRNSGFMKGDSFEGIKITVEEVDGKKVLRVAGFSGFDPSALIQDSIVELENLLPEITLKLSTGFSIKDLFGDATLKELLSAKLDLKVNWHVKMVELAIRAAGGIQDRHVREDMERKFPILIGACKFFQAQRSLVHFQFESVFEALAGIVKEIGQELLQDKHNPIFGKRSPLGKMVEEGLLDLPSAEDMETVLNAIGNISGKTFTNLRKRFLEEFYIPMSGRHGHEYKALPMAALKMAMKSVEKTAFKVHEGAGFNGRGHSSRDDKLAVLVLKLARLYFKAQRSLTGVVGVKCATCLCEVGVVLNQIGEFFQTLPSLDEFNASQALGTPLIASALVQDPSGRPNPGPEWMPAYFETLQKSFRKGGEVTRPSEEYLAGLQEDMSELIDVIKAAMPYIDSVDREAFPAPPELVKSVEDEARLMFGLV